MSRVRNERSVATVLPASGGRLPSAQCCLMYASTWASASARVSPASSSSSRPERSCIVAHVRVHLRRAPRPGGLMTMSMPSPSTLRSKSVTSAATSIRASATMSRPVISQSIQTSRSLTRGHPTHAGGSRYLLRIRSAAPPRLRRVKGGVQEWFGTLARLVVGGVWLVAGAIKVPNGAESVRAVRAYRSCPEAIVPTVGHVAARRGDRGRARPDRRRAHAGRWPSSRRCCSSPSSSASPRPGRAASRSTAAASAAAASTPTRPRSTRGRSPATSACCCCRCGWSGGRAPGFALDSLLFRRPTPAPERSDHAERPTTVHG